MSRSAARSELQGAAWRYVEACEKAELAAALRTQRARRILDHLNDDRDVGSAPVPHTDQEDHDRAVRFAARIDVLLMVCHREANGTEG